MLHRLIRLVLLVFSIFLFGFTAMIIAREQSHPYLFIILSIVVYICAVLFNVKLKKDGKLPKTGTGLFVSKIIIILIILINIGSLGIHFIAVKGFVTDAAIFFKMFSFQLFGIIAPFILFTLLPSNKMKERDQNVSE